MNYGLEDIEVQELLVAKKPTPRPSRSRTPVGELKKTVICSRCRGELDWLGIGGFENDASFSLCHECGLSLLLLPPLVLSVCLLFLCDK